MAHSTLSSMLVVVALVKQAGARPWCSASTRWPGHWPATQDVDMQVEHRLRSLGPIIYDNAETAVAHCGTALFTSHTYKVAQDVLMVWSGMPDLCQAFAPLWDDQQVHRSSGIDVLEDKTKIVLVGHPM